MQRGARASASKTAAAEASRQVLVEALQAHRAGRLDEAAALYRRILAAQPTHADALHLSGQIAESKGDHATALALIAQAIASNGHIAAFHVSLGVVLLALGRLDEARRALQRALRLDHDSAEAHNVLGNVLLRLGERDTSLASYRRALALRPRYAEAHNNLGSALRALRRLDEAESELRRAVELRPGYASALANLGLVLQEQARYSEALDGYDRALASDPTHAAAHGNRAMLLLLLGRLREGFAEYEWRWRMPGFATPRREFPQPMWNGGPLAGRTLLVHAEQGLGSAIHFARYAGLAAARGGRVFLECRRPLHRLFAQSLVRPAGPVADIVVKDEGPPPPFDCHAPLMSLPHLLGTTLDTIPGEVPYLTARREDVAAWRERLAGAPRPRIGLVWAGNPDHENDRNRSMPAQFLARLVTDAPAASFSLQVPASGELSAAFPPGSVADLAPALGDFADTAAVVANLDLVISVDTALAHLAGALARPVWLLLPYVPEWRWLLDRDDSPWYPTMRLFRQRRPGDWGGLVEHLTGVLRAWCSDAGAPPVTRSRSAGRGAPSDVASRLIADGVRHHRQGRLEKAARCYRRALELEPGQPDGLHLSGLIAHQSGDQSRARNLIAKAIAANARQAPYHNSLGVVLLALDEPGAAEGCFHQALALDPLYAEAHNNLGNALQAQDRLQEAVAAYDQAIENRPAYAEAWCNRGRTLHLLDQPLAAVESFRRALAERPDWPKALRYLGDALGQQGEREQAEECYRRALALDPADGETHAALAALLERANRLQEGLAAAEEALRRNPRDIRAGVTAARAERRLGRTEDGLDAWKPLT